MIYPHIIRKDVDPTNAPPEAGIHWVNTLTNFEWFSVGTATVADWLPRTGVIGPQGPPGSSETLVIEHYIADQTITNEDIVRSDGAALITFTLPSAVGLTKRITFKHSGDQDLTIVGILGQKIDDNDDIQLRGGKKSAVTLFPEGGNWWIA